MTTLYFKEGGSDKVYQAEIVPVPNTDLYNVQVAWGRRGTTLQTGVKNTVPVSAIEAANIFNKVLKEKMAKGYTEGADGKVYKATDAEDRFTGIIPMLPNPIDISEVDKYLNDPDWCMEEKLDGVHIALRKQLGRLDAINRRGLIVGCPEVILKEADKLNNGRDFLIDGEMMGEFYRVHDIIVENVTHWDRLHQRYLLFQGAPRSYITEVPTWYGGQKYSMYQAYVDKNAEGVVFKHTTGLYHPGRPASGGPILKLKFYEMASVIVTKINAQRSVGMGVWDGDKLIFCGNVTIPPNKEIPSVGDLIEVRYLYAFEESNSLYQQTYLGPRSDIVPADCTLSQFKFKPEEE